MSLPPTFPSVRLTIVGDTTATSRCDEGYLRVKRLSLVARYGDAPEASASFRYDTVERWNQDAVAVVPHFVREGVRHVILRSSVRPPLALRPDPLIATGAGMPEGVAHGELWEIPAGLVEKDERTAEGLVRCVVRETHEELGLRIGEASVRQLGGAMLPSSGIIGEVIYLYECEVDPDAHAPPEGDGSPLEHGARIVHVPLDEALDWCERGLLPDAKTELGLRRLAARLSGKRA